MGTKRTRFHGDAALPKQRDNPLIKTFSLVRSGRSRPRGPSALTSIAQQRKLGDNQNRAADFRQGSLGQGFSGIIRLYRREETQISNFARDIDSVRVCVTVRDSDQCQKPLPDLADNGPIYGYTRLGHSLQNGSHTPLIISPHYLCCPIQSNGNRAEIVRRQRSRETIGKSLSEADFNILATAWRLAGQGRLHQSVGMNQQAGWRVPILGLHYCHFQQRHISIARPLWEPRL